MTNTSGLTIATDVHAIRDHDDAYNADFMAAAHVLFLSHERLSMPPADWAREAMQRYGNDVVVIGLGSDGALLAVQADGFIGRLPAAAARPIVSTVGAGDASCASLTAHGDITNTNPLLLNVCRESMLSSHAWMMPALAS